MTKLVRARKDPRREATRAALIESAETLFAEHGVDGVSLRQLGASIGSSNTNVVTYHFGSKDALVAAVVRYRVPAIEARRAEFLKVMEKQGRTPDFRDLVEVLFRPFLEQTNEQGLHSYAGFLAGMFRSNRLAVRASLSAEYPVTSDLLDRMKAALPVSAQPLFMERLQIAVGMIISSLQLSDRMELDEEGAEALFNDTLLMAAAALVVPAGPMPDNGRKK